VRNDMSRDKIDVLMHHVEQACGYLDGSGMPATKTEHRTHEKQRRRC